MVEGGGAESIEPVRAGLSEIGRRDRAAGNRCDERHAIEQRPAAGILHLAQLQKHAMRERSRPRAAAGESQRNGVTLDAEILRYRSGYEGQRLVDRRGVGQAGAGARHQAHRGCHSVAHVRPPRSAGSFRPGGCLVQTYTDQNLPRAFETSRSVEGSRWPGSSPAMALSSCSARTLPSSTPHWSNGLMPHRTPAAKVRCS